MKSVVVAAIILVQSTSFAGAYCQHPISREQFECAMRASVINPLNEKRKRVLDEYKKPVTEILKGARTVTSNMSNVVKYRSPLPIMIVPDKTVYPWRSGGEVR